VTPPPLPRTPGRPDHRACLPWAAVHAAHTAHKAAAHDGHLGYSCRTCTRYLAARVDAHAREATP
jgi:hypothetical protein